MTQAQPNPFLRHIRHLIGSIPAADMSDGQLLERFLAHRDETAVEVLVRRYGPLVLGVCRRVLHDAHAAEDAFQATFLILVRKAPSLDRGRPLGSWLYTVAYRLALTARAKELHRRQCEEQAARRRLRTEGPAINPGDLVVALEEELHRLPERHRAPLVLCYLEGKTNDQAAEILGCPRGSMAARLVRAKERLRECLARRGFMAPAAGIATALATAAQAVVPLPLLDNTVRAALWFVRGEACAASFVSAQAVALAKGAFRAMFVYKLKIAGVILLVVAMLGTGATMLLKVAPPPGSHAQAGEQPPPEVRTKPSEVPGPASERRANAALQYGQAFIALRRGFKPIGEKKLLAECQTIPLDADARELVVKCGYALRMMQQGAKLPRCDWRGDFERGIEVSFTHGDGARQLSALACLRARLRFTEGQSAEAIDDIIAALTMARHISLDGTLESLWIGYEIEQRMSETLALYLPSIDSKMLRHLKSRLDALPPRGSVATATMRMEEELLTWIVGEVKEAKDKERLLAFLSQLCGEKSAAAEKNRAKGRAFLEACGGTAEGVVKSAEEMRSFSARLAKMLDLPPDQVAKAFEREETKRAGNPVFNLFSPVLHNVRRRQAQADVRRALLSAALAVQLNGRDVLKNHADPVVGGPFDYVAFEGGFELRSKWKLDDKPVALTVGRRGK
ncbi:MAG TPA: sigma-70 family RNA polymerase sigma factor [Gemmataceae bacterium]|jgi:RNA polymerase sigma factor (sigma-70 family)